MATITDMTVCAGGEHVTLHVQDADGKRYTIPCLASELAPTQQVKETAIVDAVKTDISLADAKTFTEMRLADEEDDDDLLMMA